MKRCIPAPPLTTLPPSVVRLCPAGRPHGAAWCSWLWVPASRCRASPPRWPTLTPTAAAACPPTWSRWEREAVRRGVGRGRCVVRFQPSLVKGQLALWQAQHPSLHSLRRHLTPALLSLPCPALPCPAAAGPARLLWLPHLRTHRRQGGLVPHRVGPHLWVSAPAAGHQLQGQRSADWRAMASGLCTLQPARCYRLAQLGSLSSPSCPSPLLCHAAPPTPSPPPATTSKPPGSAAHDNQPPAALRAGPTATGPPVPHAQTRQAALRTHVPANA